MEIFRGVGKVDLELSEYFADHEGYEYFFPIYTFMTLISQMFVQPYFIFHDTYEQLIFPHNFLTPISKDHFCDVFIFQNLMLLKVISPVIN